MMNDQYVAELTKSWENDPRWQGIKRPYTAEDVVRLRGSVQIEYTLARMGAERLWQLLHSEPYVAALGALTGNQAVQQVKAGLQAIYLSGWQVAQTPISRARCIPIRASIPPTASHRLYAESTRLCSVPTRFIILKGKTAPTGSLPSLPTAKQASAVRSTFSR